MHMIGGIILTVFGVSFLVAGLGSTLILTTSENATPKQLGAQPSAATVLLMGIAVCVLAAMFFGLALRFFSLNTSMA
jgi:hypothetical protein